jgi:hypothetical protein
MHVGLRGPTAVAHGCGGVGVRVEGTLYGPALQPSPTRLASNFFARRHRRNTCIGIRPGHARLLASVLYSSRVFSEGRIWQASGRISPCVKCTAAGANGRLLRVMERRMGPELEPSFRSVVLLVRLHTVCQRGTHPAELIGRPKSRPGKCTRTAPHP